MNSQQYLKDFVIPYFSSFIDKDFDMGLFAPDGTVLLTTKKGANAIGLTEEEVIGLSYKKDSDYIIQKICALTELNQEKDFKKVFEKIAKIHDIVVQEQIIINYIDIIPYKTHYIATLVTEFPIFNPHNNEVVATQTIGSNYHLYGLNDYLNDLHDKQELIVLKAPKPKGKFNLSQRQHEVLFLLSIGLSQSKIAHILGVTRGTISTIITQQLMNKLNLPDSNTQTLIAYAHKMNIHKNVPMSLYKPKVMILDEKINKKYFS